MGASPLPNEMSDRLTRNVTITFPVAQMILFFQSVSSLIKSGGRGWGGSCSVVVNMVFFKEKKAKENSSGFLAFKMVMGRTWGLISSELHILYV